jgi:hypothetical protein
MLLATAPLAVPLADTPWQAISLLAIAVCGSGGLYSLTASDAYSRLPPDRVAHAGGLIACAQSVALIVLNPLIGSVVDAYGNYDGVAIGLGLWAIPGALIWIAWKPR